MSIEVFSVFHYGLLSGAPEALLLAHLSCRMHETVMHTMFNRIIVENSSEAMLPENVIINSYEELLSAGAPVCL